MQSLFHLGHRGEASLAVQIHGANNHLLGARVHRRIQPADRAGLGGLQRDGGQVGEQVEQGGPEGVNIAAGIGLALAILFGGGITGGAHGDGILGLSRLMGAGDAEVNQLEHPFGGEHDIGRFEVTIDNRRLAGMQVLEHPAELNAIGDHLLFEERGIGLVETRFERLPGDELHHQGGAALVLEQVGNHREIGEGERTEQFSFLEEELAVLGPFFGGQLALGPHLFQRPDGIVGHAAHAVDGAHPAAPDQIQHDIAIRGAADDRIGSEKIEGYHVLVQVIHTDAPRSLRATRLYHGRDRRFGRHRRG